jgi:hypothetical protein
MINAGLPAGLGINIHFTSPRPHEMDQLAVSGVKWVRMDLAWSDTERARDQYDFRAYDTLMKALDQKGMRAILILDYGNPLYDQGQAPRTEEGRAAFTKWAVAAVTHFRNKGVVWEMWNEPNGSFWKPKPDAAAYSKLATEVGKALQDRMTDEIFIGPGTSGIDLAFLESCFRAGCLRYWSAVSVHPYRPFVPETAAPDYQRVRELILKYAPTGRHINLICSEWGYPSVVWQHSATQQAKFLAREWLTNLSCGIPLSIWYDWRDDGTSMMDPEHHFGIVGFKYHPDGSAPFDPKPAYFAANALTRLLSGFHFDHSLPTANADDYALSFRDGEEERFVVWTDRAAHKASVPIHEGTFSAYSFLGDAGARLSANYSGLTVTLSDAPLFLIPEQKH